MDKWETEMVMDSMEMAMEMDSTEMDSMEVVSMAIKMDSMATEMDRMEMVSIMVIKIYKMAMQIDNGNEELVLTWKLTFFQQNKLTDIIFDYIITFYNHFCK